MINDITIDLSEPRFRAIYLTAADQEGNSAPDCDSLQAHSFLVLEIFYEILIIVSTKGYW